MRSTRQKGLDSRIVVFILIVERRYEPYFPATTA